MRFSANLGFLWNDLPLPDAIRRAAQAGFDAVECHFPFDEDPQTVRKALDDTGLPMVGLNTRPGDKSAGDFGLCAVPGREQEAQAAIREAIGYATAIGAGAVHVMAGISKGSRARETFLSALDHASDLAEQAGLQILIEPINSRDIPGYFLSTTAEAEEILSELGRAPVKLMFDCYHVQIMEGDICRRLERLLPLIGHVQIAGVPDRAEPDQSEIDYRYVLRHLQALGYGGFIGAEYRPRASVEDGLGWIDHVRS